MRHGVYVPKAVEPRQEGRRKGAMIYSHKTAGEIQIMSEESYEHYQSHSKRKGQGSCLRNVLVGNGRLM